MCQCVIIHIVKKIKSHGQFLQYLYFNRMHSLIFYSLWNFLTKKRKQCQIKNLKIFGSQLYNLKPSKTFICLFIFIQVIIWLLTDQGLQKLVNEVVNCNLMWCMTWSWLMTHVINWSWMHDLILIDDTCN